MSHHLLPNFGTKLTTGITVCIVLGMGSDGMQSGTRATIEPRGVYYQEQRPGFEYWARYKLSSFGRTAAGAHYRIRLRAVVRKDASGRWEFFGTLSLPVLDEEPSPSHYTWLEHGVSGVHDVRRGLSLDDAATLAARFVLFALPKIRASLRRASRIGPKTDGQARKEWESLRILRAVPVAA